MRFLSRVLLALLLVVGVACSGDDDETADATSTTTSTTSTTVGALDADDIDREASPYCATWADIRGTAPPDLTGDPDADAENRKEHYAALVPLAERLVTEADEEIKPAAEQALEQVREVARTGSTEPFETPEATELQQELARYAQEHCATS